MELWIRSQNKERLIKINNIEIQHHYSYKDAQKRFLLPNGGFEYRKVQEKDKYIESVLMCNDEICLGKYSSKERTLKVLDEITGILKFKQSIALDNEVNIRETLEQNFTEEQIDYVSRQMHVYEMPKD